MSDEPALAREIVVSKNGHVNIVCECERRIEFGLGPNWRHMDDVRAQEIANVKTMSEADFEGLIYNLRLMRRLA